MFGLMSTSIGLADLPRRQDTGSIRGGPASSRTTGLACGLVAGTRIATAMGWRPVEAIAEGDLVLTFDRGLQPVRAITRGLNWSSDTPCPKGLRPLSVPAGALGNQEAMTLLSDQSVMVESDTADALFGDPFALVPASSLDGFRGIARIRDMVELDVIQLQFDCDEIIFASLGALAFCPCSRMLGIDTILSAETDEPPAYRKLPQAEAAMLIDCVADEDAVAERIRAAMAPLYAAASA